MDGVGVDVGVRVAAEDDVDVLGVGGQAQVVGVGGIGFVADVGDGDDHVARVDVFQPPGGGVGGVVEVDVFHAVIVAVGDDAFGVEVQRHDAETFAAELADGGGGESFGEIGVFELVVRGQPLWFLA